MIKRTRGINAFAAFGLAMLIALSAIASLQVADNHMAAATRVACVGDSITEYSGYPQKLQSMLGNGYTVGNFGVSGATVVENSKIPYLNQRQFESAIKFEPDVVLIMLGTNDANPEIALSHTHFEEDYAQLVRAFQQLNNPPEIVVVKSPPIFSNNSAYSNTLLVDTVFPSIDHFTNQMNLPTVDMYSVLANHPDYFADGVHPNDNGSTAIATAMYDALSSAEDNDAVVSIKG